MRMRAKLVKMAILAVLIPVIYWGVTAGMIEYSVHYVSVGHGCVVIIPFNHTRFLISMGHRSVSPLRHRISDPKIGTNGKIYLAWILGQLGDYSQFQVFIDALGSKSKSNQFMAVQRMQYFPKECLRHLPDILTAGRQPQHYAYSGMLFRLADSANLGVKKIDLLGNAIAIEVCNGQRGLTDEESKSILQIFQSGGE